LIRVFDLFETREIEGILSFAPAVSSVGHGDCGLVAKIKFAALLPERPAMGALA
jgi:hypothetical protein